MLAGFNIQFHEIRVISLAWLTIDFIVCKDQDHLTSPVQQKMEAVSFWCLYISLLYLFSIIITGKLICWVICKKAHFIKNLTKACSQKTINVKYLSPFCNLIRFVG